MAIGTIRALLAAKDFNRTLDRVRERQESIFDRERIEKSVTRLQRDAEAIGPLLERAQVALATMERALRVVSIATRVLVKLR